MSPAWFRRDGAGEILLNLHVQPGARKTEIAGLHGDALKVRLAAPPVDGRANECLIEFIAGLLGVSRACVGLESGATSRRKRLRVRGAALERVEGLVLAAR